MFEKNRKKEAPEEAHPFSINIPVILLFVVGIILFLSVLSYHPSQIPNWGIFETFAAKNTTKIPNYLGTLGALVALGAFILFGAAVFILPVIMIGLSVMSFFMKKKLWPNLIICMFLSIVSLSIFIQASEPFLSDWVRRTHLSQIGGAIGYNFTVLLKSIIGNQATIIGSGIVYLVSIIFLTGKTPSQFFTESYQGLSHQWQEWRKRRESVRKVENEILLKKPTTSSRQLNFGQKLTEMPALDKVKLQEQPNLPGLKEMPTPKIVDSSQQRIPELPITETKPFERKLAPHNTSTIYSKYQLPSFDLLDAPQVEETAQFNQEELLQIQRNIIETLKSFGIEVTAGDITRGPTITRYEIYPSTGLRVSRITQLEADLARATCAERINILAPIPGKDTVGIEIANTIKVAVPLSELLHDPDFRSAKKKIPLALGKDVYGKTVIGDLAAMPHLLVAGATGSGKSVCINSIITSILYKFSPDELRFIMVDPKVVEMQIYNKLPHLVVPVVTDPKKTVAALKWVVNEMEKRYRMFAKEGVRNFDGFNQRPRHEKKNNQSEEPILDDETLDAIVTSMQEGDVVEEADELDAIQDEDIPDRFPYIVVLIDELADLMQTAPADVEMCIARIAQKARAAGIHLIIATQTPRADVVTGIIKANIPCRIAFQVSSALDSRVILDTKGADKLVGKGDMLYLPPGSAKLERSQGAFVSDAEVERIVEHCGSQGIPRFDINIQEEMAQSDSSSSNETSDADEELIVKCIEVVRQEQKASTSLLQRRLRLGYTRAARMIDILEERGIVGPGDGAKAREVY